MPIVPSAVIHSCSFVYLRSVGYCISAFGSWLLACSAGILPAVPRVSCPRRGGRGRTPDSRRDGGATTSSDAYKTASVPLVLSRPARGFRLLPSFQAQTARVERRLTQYSSSRTAQENRWSRSRSHDQPRPGSCIRRGRFLDQSFRARQAFSLRLPLSLSRARRAQ